MKNALINLLKIKSLITLIVVSCLAYGFISGKINSNDFLPIATMIFTFYFTKKESKEE